jgi:Tol biopolymer transport system component
LAVLVALAGCGEVKIEKRRQTSAEEVALANPQETRLESVRQLTTQGVNRQASFSADGRTIIWLTRPDERSDFQVAVMQADGGAAQIVAAGTGRRTSPAFSPDGNAILYAAPGGPAGAGAAGRGTAHGDGTESAGGAAAAAAGAEPGAGADALWLFDPALDLYRASPSGASPLRLTDTPGYDAEASYSWGGAKIVFTSFRDGVGSLFLMNADGSAAQALTAGPGYAGGAQISPDGSRVVYHAVAAAGRQEMEIFVMDLEGMQARQVTTLGATSCSPCWHPSQEYVIFCSNVNDRDFELYTVRLDGAGLERVTWNPGFDGFPSFSRGGDALLWTSLRRTSEAGQTQVFKANWRP